MNAILDDNFTNKYTPEQIVVAVNEAARTPELQTLFKRAGITYVVELNAMRFHHD